MYFTGTKLSPLKDKKCLAARMEASSRRNNLIKLNTIMKQRKERAHDSQIVRTKESKEEGKDQESI